MCFGYVGVLVLVDSLVRDDGLMRAQLRGLFNVVREEGKQEAVVHGVSFQLRSLLLLAPQVRGKLLVGEDTEVDAHVVDRTSEDEDGEGGDQERRLHDGERVAYRRVLALGAVELELLDEATARSGEILGSEGDRGQREGDAAAQAREPHEEHVGFRDGRRVRLRGAEAVEHPRADVDVHAAHEARDQRAEHEPEGRGMEDGEGECGHAQVDEHVRLGYDCDTLVGAGSELARILVEVEARVHGHDHAAEHDGDAFFSSLMDSWAVQGSGIIIITA